MAEGFFLPPEEIDDQGLAAVGGDLSPERLLEAYCRGIFPCYHADEPILWWSPDPRAIFELDGLHISRRLARTLRSGRFSVTFNQNFAGVLDGCADRPAAETWIHAPMRAAYLELHHLGHAHSVEVWHQGLLAGGVYGVAIAGLFAGESMFTRVRDASKVALAHLVDRLRQRGFQLFDVQILNAHTARLGAVEIPRADYLARLRRALECPTAFG
jgi:leucyl/phenylalanyl-tRNA--protein transferase